MTAEDTGSVCDVFRRGRFDGGPPPTYLCIRSRLRNWLFFSIKGCLRRLTSQTLGEGSIPPYFLRRPTIPVLALLPPTRSSKASRRQDCSATAFDSSSAPAGTPRGCRRSGGNSRSGSSQTHRDTPQVN